MRSSEEITMRCKLILDQPNIVSLDNKSSSPTAAYHMVMDAAGNDETAKAARWLGVLRRDYPNCYAELTHNILCTFRGTRLGKERRMKKVYAVDLLDHIPNQRKTV